MNASRCENQISRRLLTGLAVVSCIAMAARPGFAEAVPPPASPEGYPLAAFGPTQFGSGASVLRPLAEEPAVSPQGTAGMTVYIDPQTGAILSEPAPGTVPLQVSPQLQNALSTSHQGLVQVPSSVPGGGVKLDLQGRFQSPLIVATDADGKVKMRHLGQVHGSSDPR